MKILNPNNSPKVLSEKEIDILAKMSNEIPQSKEWKEIFKILNKVDLRKVMDRRISIQSENIEHNEGLLSENEKNELQEKKDNFYEKLKPDSFYGNMGQPETPQEYKNRYGVWPPGYDENGNKIEP